MHTQGRELAWAGCAQATGGAATCRPAAEQQELGEACHQRQLQQQQVPEAGRQCPHWPPGNLIEPAWRQH